MKQRIAKGTLSLLVFTGSVCSLAPRTEGQISEEDGPKIDAFQERERGMAQDPSAEGPPADDPNEPDVAKRKRFGWELGRKRLSFGCPLNIDFLKEAANDIPEKKKANLLERCSTFVTPELRPPPDLVQWYGQWFSTRDGRKLHLYVAEWSIDGVVVRVSQLADRGRYLRFLIRFPKRPSLQFRSMPPDFQGYSSQWEFVSKAEVRKLLSEFFDVPYTSDSDFELRGRATTCAGVGVFTGRIRPPRRIDLDEGANTVNGDGGLPWIGPDRVLITDSDPQYICVSFDLRNE